MKKKQVIIISIIMFLGIVGFIISLIFEPGNKERRDKTKEDNIKLISENILDFKDYEFKSVNARYKYAPKNKDNILLLHSKKDEWNLYSIKGINILNNLTKEDLEKVDAIVFAISNFYSKNYQYTGSKARVSISTESVDLYFYNPKTQEFFLKTTMKAHELPKTTNSSHNYTYSVHEIETRIKKQFNIYVMPAWLEILLFILLLFVLPITICIIIATIKRKKKLKNVNQIKNNAIKSK